ncbi:MAG: hypothetical protein J6D28_03830 [Bacilli bacterium]|nr:hypothetical protein [Bacilli bacterium]
MNFSSKVKEICSDNEKSFYDLFVFLEKELPKLILDGEIFYLVDCIEDIIRCGDGTIFHLLKENNISDFKDVVVKAYEVITKNEFRDFNMWNLNYYNFFMAFGSSCGLSKELINKIKCANLDKCDFLVVAFEVFKCDREAAVDIFKNFSFKGCMDQYLCFEMQLEYLKNKDYCDFVNCHIEDLIKYSDDWLSLFEKFPKAKEARLYLQDLIKRNHHLFICNARKCARMFNVFDDCSVRNALALYVKSFFKSYINEFRRTDDLFVLKSIFKGVPELDDFIRDYFNDNKKNIVERMFLNTQKNLWFNNIDRNNIKLVVDVLELIIDDICLDVGISFGDIKRIGNGTYSNVYEIGDKVLKIGSSRACMILPENPYALKPLLHRVINLDSLEMVNDINGIRNSIVIEVCKKVKPFENNELNEEQLYDFYRKMRNIGIDLQDIKCENFGVLEDDGVEALWRKKLNPSNEVLNIKKNPYYNEEVVLKKGDVVLIDRDIYYLVDDEYVKNIDSNPCRFYWNKFKKRYEEEANCHKTKPHK